MDALRAEISQIQEQIFIFNANCANCANLTKKTISEIGKIRKIRIEINTALSRVSELLNSFTP